MTEVLVLYYSAFGHIETMASAVAEGVRRAGTTVTVKRVPELVPEDVARKSGYRLNQTAPLATVAELADYDAIIIGTPTRFGNMAAQMKNFLDQLGGLRAKNALVGRVGGVFTSTGSQHGRQETTHCPPASGYDDRRSALHLQRTGADGRNQWRHGAL
jgi:NAD(P)H dehydrogenase (quinone)